MIKSADDSIQNARHAIGCVLLWFLVDALVGIAFAAPPPLRVALADRALQPGELVVVTIVTAEDAAAMRVKAFDSSAPAYRDGTRTWRALVGIDLDQAPGSYAIEVEAEIDGRVERSVQSIVVRAKTYPTRRLTVDPDFVNPPAALQARLDRESEFLKKVYAGSVAERLWRAPFVRPVPGKANSQFGTRSIFNGEPRNAHGGADFLSGAGTPIKAPNAGRIVAARNLFFSGNTVIIDHGLGLFSLLAHLSRIDVAEGELVRAGQVVGAVGATGRVTGPHLHWALRVGGARVDPLGALALLRAKPAHKSPPGAHFVAPSDPDRRQTLRRTRLEHCFWTVRSE